MSNYTISEDASNTSRRRYPSRVFPPSLHLLTISRNSSLGSPGVVHSQPELSLTGFSAFAAAQSTMSEIGTWGNGNTYPNVLGNAGIINEGLGSLNRWSQSTASSKSPLNNNGSHRRGNSTLSGSGGYDGPDSPNGCVSPASNTLSRKLGLTIDADYIHTQQSRSPCQSASPINGGGSNSSQSDLMLAGPSSSNLLQDRRVQEMKFARHHTFNDPANANHVAQSPRRDVKGIDSTVGDDMPQFIDSESSLGKRHRGHSQKAMLSKALQKANTAVLLDNAANFEGAMDAYSESCQLLQLVMLRSSGGSGEKSKLQEIVCVSSEHVFCKRFSHRLTINICSETHI